MPSRTANDMSPLEWKKYHPFALSESNPDPEQLSVGAMEIAKNIARVLVQRFGADKVVLFGSLARGDFSRWSDIDLAVWGVAPEVFFRAVAFACGVSTKWKVDLVDGQDCHDDLKESILREGILL